ncbi:hypothetical protein Hokovirus_1_18 [Hokovirus HKV1]|uniref:Uncharacterized protein n=1 Tax=Hokovirus HKV1 TaxID=1977638 RepID=A0A1V0SEI9_9VIRU|nr:hypothetical protein Hokovirus_1_18 [Hokovirus HKV1]
MELTRRTLTPQERNTIASQQLYKCANKPDSNIRFLESFDCPLWLNEDINIQGMFNNLGYDIDHIMEFRLTQDNSRDNLPKGPLCLHALCKI